jgi:tetratricopeptide (TPR) repeat protein
VGTLSKLGKLLEYELGELDDAMECYQKLLEIDPENVVALNGIDRLKAKRTDVAGQMKSIFWETIAEYRRVLALQHTE